MPKRNVQSHSDCVDWVIAGQFRAWGRTTSEEGEWKSNSPAVSIPHLFILLDRGLCYAATSDLHKQPWESERRIRTSHIIVPFTTMKPEPASQRLLHPTKSLTEDKKAKETPFQLKASIFNVYRFQFDFHSGLSFWVAHVCTLSLPYDPKRCCVHLQISPSAKENTKS